MPSKKVAMILKSKTDLSDAEIDKLSDSDGWKLIYSLRTEKVKDNRLHICFTGFNDTRKKELIKIAEKSNLKVTSSVIQSLDFLCTGKNAGYKKLEVAMSQGVQLLTEDEFILFSQTGEVPN